MLVCQHYLGDDAETRRHGAFYKTVVFYLDSLSLSLSFFSNIFRHLSCKRPTFAVGKFKKSVPAG